MAAIATSRKTPNPRSKTLTILCVGTVAALACSIGPVWLVRVGLVVALLTAFASVLLTWRQMDQMVAEHLAEVRALREQSRAAAAAHHTEMMKAIERFSERQDAYRREIAGHKAELERLRSEVAAVSLDAEAKQTRISALNKIVSDLEKELAAAADEAEQVMNLPRRGKATRGAAIDLSGLPLVYPVGKQRRRA
ncbi:hypothetical protein [Luteococcus sp. OSA5]|uniref:hypothetical protein n=1 Tax=Luteococcus sp. OSA5 TaxID=3401630 RepID=UPI003B42BC99